jgi:hypothetical protein
MLIRRPGQPWHPLQPALHDERALQTLLVQSPSLLPSPGPGELAVAANFRIGSTASVDLLGVGVDGRIVLVECGRQEGPGRRPMGGAALAVGAGLWRAPYEEFDRAFAVRAGVPLLDKVSSIARAGSLGWDENAFRSAVTENLSTGRFQLILAVDVVSDEVRQVVAYLNAGARPGLASVALGLRYHAEEGVEVLIPSVFRADGGREEGTDGSRTSTEIPLMTAVTSGDTPAPGQETAGVQAQASPAAPAATATASVTAPAPKASAPSAAPAPKASAPSAAPTSAPATSGPGAAGPGPGRASATGASSPFEPAADQEGEAPATSIEPSIADETDSPVIEISDSGTTDDADAEPVSATRASAGRKGGTAAPVGTQGEHALFSALEESCLPAAVDAVRRLYHIARDRGRELQWGHGDHPAVMAVYEVEGKPVGVWSCYTDLKPSFVVNFEWLAPHVPIDRLQRLADRLAELPSVPERLAGLAEAGYKRRLALAVNAVLAQPGAADLIHSALTELIDPEAAKAAAAAASSVPPPPPGSRR